MPRLSAHPPIRWYLPSHTLRDRHSLIELLLVQSLLSEGWLRAPPRVFDRPVAVRTTLRVESWAAIRYSLRCCAMAELHLMHASSTSAAGSGYWPRYLPPPSSATHAPHPHGRRHGPRRRSAGHCADSICEQTQSQRRSARCSIFVIAFRCQSATCARSLCLSATSWSYSTCCITLIVLLIARC